MVEVKFGIILVSLNLGGFQLHAVEAHEKDRITMISTSMARICCGFKVPSTLLQIKAKTLLIWDDRTTDKVQQVVSTLVPKYGFHHTRLQAHN